MIPIILKLKKELHKNIALAQDLLVQELYKVFNNAVIHGGTAIWRCYKGNRFSEDLDVYLKKDINKLQILFSNLEKKGFTIVKKKIAENSLYSELELNRNYIRFEAIFKYKDGRLKDYETSEGNFISVYTLTAEELVNEKINAYLNRLKIRDLYDIFFLLKYAEDNSKIKSNLQKFVKDFKKPVDENELKILILEGLIPRVEKMLDYIKNYI
ncbi:MAG: nucleotidyl transferase AbiEii/AbiGii toxin family protein [Nanoarchaeota archaeon]